MKKYILLLFMFVACHSVFGQTVRPVPPGTSLQPQGSQTTFWNQKGIIYSTVGYAPAIYPDTATANLISPAIKNIPFFQISTTSDGKSWQRNLACTKWESFSFGSGGGGTWGSITGTLTSQTDLYDSLLARLRISDTAAMLLPYRHWTQGYSLVGNDWSITGNSGTTPGTNFVGTTDAQDVVFKRNGSEFMRGSTGGNVGVGTAAPAAKFQVDGTLRFVTGNQRDKKIFASNKNGDADWINPSHYISEMDTSVSNKLLDDWVSQTTPLSANAIWVNYAYSPELHLLVAVSHGGTDANGVMTSPDGITWTLRTCPVQQWRGIAWSPKLHLFAACAGSGTGNRFMTSPDGINWTSRTSTGDYRWRKMIWNDETGLFIAIANTAGFTDKVSTSPDGITWTARTCPDREWSDIAYSKELGLFVVSGTNTYSGSDEKIMTSPDAINWTLRSAGSGDLGWWEGISWSPDLGLFVCNQYGAIPGNAGKYMMTSPDGINWTLRDAPSGFYLSSAWSSELGYFVACGEGGLLSTSRDGINWTARTVPNKNWRRVYWIKELGCFGVIAYTFDVTSTVGNLFMISRPIDVYPQYLSVYGRQHDQSIRGNIYLPDLATSSGTRGVRADASGKLFFSSDTTNGNFYVKNQTSAAQTGGYYLAGTTIASSHSTPGYRANLEGGFPASFYFTQSSGNYGLSIQRASASGGAAHLAFFKTRSANFSTLAGVSVGDNGGKISWHGVGSDNSTVDLYASIYDFAEGSAETYPYAGLGFNVSGSAGRNVNAMYLSGNGTLRLGGISGIASSALIDMQGTTRGFLPPRLTGAQQNAISSPATGLIIYNADSLALCQFNGSVWLKVGNSGTVTGSGTTGYLSKWTGASDLGSSGVYDDGTNVGIGTSIPSRLLHVAGKSKFTDSLQYSLGASNGYVLTSDASGNATWSLINKVDSVKSRNDSLLYYISGTEYFIKRVQPYGSYLTSVPGIDDVLAVGQSFTTSRTANGAGFNFNLYSAAGNILFNTKANSTSYGSRLYLNGDSAWYVGNNKVFVKSNGVGNIMHLNPGQTSADIVNYNKILAVKESDGEAALLPWPDTAFGLHKNLNPSDWLVTPTKRAQANWPEFYTSGVSGDSTGSYYETSMYTPSPVKMNNDNLYVWTKGDLNKVIFGWRSTNNGLTWDTLGQTIGKGGTGTFDEFSVAMPAAYHIASTDSVYLYYHGIPVYPYENGGIGLAVASGSAPNTMTKKKQALSIPDFITQMGITHNLIYVALGSVVKSGSEYYYYGAYLKAGFGMTDSTIRLWEGHSNSLDTIKNCREILVPPAPYTAYFQPTVYHGADSAWYMIFPKGYTDENGGIDSAMFLISARSATLASSSWSILPGRLYEHDVDSTWKGKRVYNAQLLKDEYGNPILMKRDSVYGYPDDGTEPFYMLFYSGSYRNSYHDQSSYLKIMPQTDSLTFGTGYNGTIPNITRRGTTILLNTPVADSVRDGQIKHEDWIKFNNKAPASGGTGYVWNQSASAQTASSWISGQFRSEVGFWVSDPNANGALLPETGGIKFQTPHFNIRSEAGLYYNSISFDMRSSAYTTAPYMFASPHITGYSTPITQNNYSLLNVGDVFYATIPSPFNTTSSALTNYSTRIVNYGHRVSGSNALTNVALYLEADSAQNNNALIIGNGNVGIGVPNPTAKFHVSGTTKFDLGSDATGDMFYRDASGSFTRLPIGAANQHLVGGATPHWVDTSAGGGGYTNLTQFISQNNWKMFYSDGSGDVQELSIGTSGKVLTSNGASSIPSWETPTSTNIYNSDGTVTAERTISGGNNNIIWQNFAEHNTTADDFIFQVKELGGGLATTRFQLDSTTGFGMYPYKGRFKIDSLNYTQSLLGKKVITRDTANGTVENFDLGYNDWANNYITTTDATTTTLATLTPPDNSRGTLEVTLIGTKPTDAAYGISGKKFIHWKKVGGTVTVSQIVGEAADYLETFTTATWTVDASGGTLRIRVTGEASTTVDWQSVHKLKYSLYSL